MSDREGNPDPGCAGRKPAFDIYATTKSGGNLMLSGGILAENITELMDIYRAGSDAEPYYLPLMVLLFLCLLLNIACIVLSLVLGTLTYPSNNTYQPSNVIVPSTEVPVSSQPQTEAVTMDMENKLSAPPPGHLTPSHLKGLNNAMTVMTGLVFILLATKNSIGSGSYGRVCPLMVQNKTGT